MGHWIAIEEEGKSRKVPLSGNELTIGRGSDNVVVINDPRSSRHHCRLLRTPQGILLEDLESRNGTLLNGATVRKSLLQVGAQFAVGNVRFRLVEGGDAKPGNGKELADDTPASVIRDSSISHAATIDALAPANRDDVLDAEEDQLELEEDGADEAGPGSDLPEVHLERLQDGKAVERIPVTSLPFVMGRGKDANLVLTDKRSSTHHARIVLDGDLVYLEDLKSTNGTLLGNRPVTRTQIRSGAVITIGNTLLRVVIAGQPAGAGSTRDAPAAQGAVPEGEEVLAFDAEKFLELDRSQHPAAVAALIVILGIVCYFTIDVTRRILHHEDPDPRDESNFVIENWSFEAPATPKSSSGVAGWALVSGDNGSLVAARDGAQPPGKLALNLSSQSDGICRAACDPAISVLEGKKYLLEGYVLNRGAFAAGLMIEWFRTSNQGDALVGRSFSDTARQAGDAVDASVAVSAPSSATSARISCFVLGSGARAAFDRVSFRLAPDAPAAEAAPGEGNVNPFPRSLAIGPTENSVTLSLEASGCFSIQRKRRSLVNELWGGLPPSSDPNLYGPRLAAARAQEDGAVAFAGEVPDFTGQTWSTLEARASISGSEAQIGWRLAGAEGAIAKPLCLYLELRDQSMPLEARGSGESISIDSLSGQATEQAMVKGVEEIVVGGREERVTISFSHPVQLGTSPHPLDPNRKLWRVEGSPEAIDMTLSGGSRHQMSLARAAIEKAEEAYRAGRAGEAISALSGLESAFPEERAEHQRAAARVEDWRKAGQREIADLDLELQAYRQTPTSVLKRVLLERAEALRTKWQGVEEGRAAEAVLLEVKKAAEEAASRGLGEELTRAMELGRKHFAADELGLAELLLRWVADADKEGKLKREAQSTLKVIEGRRNRDRSILLKQ